jgi:hypothetical protein
MNAFLVELENKPGELARVAEAIAAKGVNIEGMSGSTCGSSGTVVLITDDDAGTRSALGEANCSFREAEVVETTMSHRPGSLARTARRLADAGVNVEAAFPIGMQGDEVSVAIVTDDPARARQSLSGATAAG